MHDPICIVTRGSSYENRANLAPAFFDQIIRKYEGTRLGRQELEAELLEDTRSRINFAGRGVVVTTVRGSAPSRIPNISMSQASG